MTGKNREITVQTARESWPKLPVSPRRGERFVLMRVARSLLIWLEIARQAIRDPCNTARRKRCPAKTALGLWQRDCVEQQRRVRNSCRIGPNEWLSHRINPQAYNGCRAELPGRTLRRQS